MGALTVLWLSAALAAAPAESAESAFRFDGPSASATVDGGAAVLRSGQEVREGSGSAFLRGEDRVREREMTYGDAGVLWLRAGIGRDVYRVELDAVGFPPEEAFRTPKRTWWRFWQRRVELPEPPSQPLEGGVLLGRTLGGDSGLGRRDLPERRATVALWGIGRVYRNDELIAPRARILAQALPAGMVAPEGSLRTARPAGDPELDVVVDHLPRGVAPGGYLHFALDGASISSRERPPAEVEQRGEGAPTAGAAVEPPESGAGRLGRRLTADERWERGETMLVWRDEEPAAAAPEDEEEAEEREEAEAPELAAAEPAPPAVPQPGAQVSGSLAWGYRLDTPPGAQTVMQAPPPLTAVPPTPNTAPIQYETGQNGPYIGTGTIGGTALEGFGVIPEVPGGTGIFGRPVPPPSGIFAGIPPSAPIPGTPGAPVSGTPGAPGAGVPSAGGEVAGGAPGAPVIGTPPSAATGGQLTAGRGGFASPGIPATPRVLNDGSLPPGIGVSSTPLTTPQPLNAQPTPVPGGSFPVGGVPALPGTNPLTGQPQLPSQAPQQAQPPAR